MEEIVDYAGNILQTHTVYLNDGRNSYKVIKNNGVIIDYNNKQEYTNKCGLFAVRQAIWVSAGEWIKDEYLVNWILITQNYDNMLGWKEILHFLEFLGTIEECHFSFILTIRADDHFQGCPENGHVDHRSPKKTIRVVIYHASQHFQAIV